MSTSAGCGASWTKAAKRRCCTRCAVPAIASPRRAERVNRTRYLLSTTARLFFPLVLFQIVATGGVLVFVWVAGQQALKREQQALVSELHDDLMADFREGGAPRLAETITTRLKSQGSRAPVMLLADAAGNRIAGNLDALPPLAQGKSSWVEAQLYRSGARLPERMALSVARLPGGLRLVSGLDVGRDLRLRRSYEQALIAALLLALPLTLLVAGLIARMIGQRVHAMAQIAHRVGHGALDARVALDGSGDSFDELGSEINAMLDRIETLVGELRLVTDGLAHDLRSPVTRLKSALERAAGEVREPQALAALERAGVEAEALNAMLSTALQISRAEAGIGRDRFVATDLARFIEDLTELYGPFAEAQGFTLCTEAGAPAPSRAIHRELLGQALGNMIDNAIKYAEGGSAIRLFVRAVPGGLAIGVEDNGPGIPAARHEEARRRFGRLDPARGIAGSGLGLALVEAVARLHGGTMALNDAAPGLSVAIVLPA
ncbi:MAG: HAMP domain-containing histidine kinase [Sphingomonadales bacterium]|nr:HAMP domain-containing histidine kinase [Sphingomonadales bacterium]